MSDFAVVEYAKLYFGSIDGNAKSIMEKTGFIRFEPGDPEGSVASEIGANGAFVVKDDLASKLYRNATITLLSGCPLDSAFKALSENTAHGAGDIATFLKCCNAIEAMGVSQKTMTFLLHCVNRPGSITPYGITENGVETTQTTYSLTLYLQSVEIQ